ncbi:TolC family protein [Massilia niastensis]|uniref:TolC family protein n=1 Tax=Massilia niastensis TaxID=544911 RepID=UPI0003A9E8CD|nr:TolC family protein [Massilia niastensis]
MTRFSWQRPTAACAVLLLAGCSTFSPDGGLDAVSKMSSERIGQQATLSRDSAATSGAAADVLRQPLTPQAAVQVALMNNRSLKASLAELGIVEADLVQAGTMRNPGISYSKLRGGDSSEIERVVSFDLIGLLTLPVRKGIEQRRFAQAQLAAAGATVRLAHDTQRAYFEAVAANERARYMEQANLAAEASTELARRMARAGNWSRLDQAREEAFHGEVLDQLDQARQQAIDTREALARLLGVTAEEGGFVLPQRLPALPEQVRPLGNAQQEALDSRLDVLAAKADTRATAKSLGLTRATRVINVLEASYINKSVSGEPRENGYEISLELPLFDWGGANTARAEATYMQSVHRAADTALRARSEVRQSHAAYHSAYGRARRYRDQIVPLRRQISDEVLLRYNGMLASVFELLLDAREQIASVQASIDAQRDFWVADTALQAAIHGNGANE